MTVATFQGANPQTVATAKEFYLRDVGSEYLEGKRLCGHCKDIANGDIWPPVTVQRHRNLEFYIGVPRPANALGLRLAFLLGSDVAF